MTREEIIQAITEDKMMPFIQPGQLAQIVAFVIENYRPSLPSNIDEAAEKYSNIPYNFGEFVEIEYEFGEPIETIVDDKVFVREAFKDGVEWMAGQGETIECSVDWYDGPILDFSEEQLLSAITKAELKIGDKVVVQIRKK